MKMTALKLVVSAVVLAVVVWLTDPQNVALRLRQADITWLSLALVSLTALTFLMARRWQLVAAELDVELHYLHAVKEYYIAQLVNMLLPGGVVGDIGRAVRMRHKSDLTRAIQSVAAERVVGQTSLFAVMTLSLLVALLMPGGLAWPAITWLGVVGVVVAAIVAARLAKTQNATGTFLALIFRLLRSPGLMILSLAICGLLIFSLYASARSIGAELPSNAWLTVLPLVLSAMLVPLSVGGWGWREGAAAALFPLAGETASAGIATGIVYGAALTVAALPAAILLLLAPSNDTDPLQDDASNSSSKTGSS